MSLSLTRHIGISLMATTMLVAPGIALAQTADEKPSVRNDDALVLEDIVVSASAIGVDVRDAPASVSVMTREEIEQQPFQSLGEVLGRLPGVTGGISPTGPMSKITIRGLPDNYTLILVDGRRVGSSRDITYRPDLGRQNLNWISPDMIERIEVVRGPMSSVYGSDAMGGVINIITRKIAPTWRGSANTSYTRHEQSSRGDAYQVGLNATGPITSKLGLRVGATYARTDPDEMDISRNEGTAGVVNQNANAMLTWTPTDRQTLSLEGSYGQEDPLAPAATNAAGNTQSAWGSTIKRSNFRVGHDGKWDFGETKINLYHNDMNNVDQGDDGGKAEFKETVLDALINFEKNLIWDHKIAVGGQYREEELTNTQTIGTIPVDYEGNPVSGATLSGETAAFFIEDQITIKENLLLTLGARLDSHDKYGEHVSPRGYLVWHPTETWTLRGGISKGFRAPSLKESSAGAATFSRGGGCGSLAGMVDDQGNPYAGGCYMAGNPDLKPEESTNYEIGTSYEHGRWQVGATYFYTDFENKIEYAPLGYFEGRWWTKMENVQRARTEGLELTGSVDLPANLSLKGNATWMIEAKNLDTGAQLITTPEWTGYATLDWRATEDLNILLSARYTGEQLGGGNTITNSYTTFDLTTAFDASDTVTLRAGITNLWAKEISGSSGFGYYSPGRQFFVGLTSRF